ncbi:MAG: Uma2 family endonuclease [Solirubrobacteraceae bacterium]
MSVAVAEQLGSEDLYRYSLDAYHRLVEAGGFGENERVELLDGMIVTMSPKTPEHERALQLLTDWLYDHVDRGRFRIGVATALTLENSEPEPDLVVIERGTPAPYHPSTAALAIEVSVSSLARDLKIKTQVYGSAGVLEYWVLDLQGRRLVAHRDPTDDGYADRREYSAGERVTATAVELPPLDLGELLAVTGG